MQSPYAVSIVLTLPEKGRLTRTHFFLFLGTSLLNVARICVVLLLVHPTRFLRCKRREQAGESGHRKRND